jgi:hypothetical protein
MHLNGGKQKLPTLKSHLRPYGPVRPIPKSLPKRDGPKAPTAIRGDSGLKFYLSEKDNAIADCLEIQFTPHDLCDENHERWVEARVQAPLEDVDNSPLRG